MNRYKRISYPCLIIVLLFAAGWDRCAVYDPEADDPEIVPVIDLGVGAPVQAGDDLDEDGNGPMPDEDATEAADVREDPAADALEAAGLTVPPEMEGRVKLWETVYGDYDRSRFVLYNKDCPGIIYGTVVDLPGRKEREIARIQTRLLVLHDLANRFEDPRPEIEKRSDAALLSELYDKFAGIDSADKFVVAAQSKNIGALRGRKRELRSAFIKSAPYLSAMEDIFRQRGLPPELTRMVFVESGFDRTARSSKGAHGVWQFLPEAARPRLTMTSSVDERRDPLLATNAAAEILDYNYKRLGDWPLAVTAYNAGLNRMCRARLRTGAKTLPDILDQYDHKAFGFAVENFYARLIGVIRAERKLGLRRIVQNHHFNAADYDTVRLSVPINLNSLSRKLGMSPVILIALNPSWTMSVERSWSPIPAGFKLRVPKGSAPVVRAALNLPTPEAPQSAQAETAAGKVAKLGN